MILRLRRGRLIGRAAVHNRGSIAVAVGSCVHIAGELSSQLLDFAFEFANAIAVRALALACARRWCDDTCSVRFLAPFARLSFIQFARYFELSAAVAGARPLADFAA